MGAMDEHAAVMSALCKLRSEHPATMSADRLKELAEESVLLSRIGFKAEELSIMQHPSGHWAIVPSAWVQKAKKENGGQ
jgi:hypothetical protein